MPTEIITTLVTAAPSYDLVDLDDVRAELKLKDSDTSQDNFLQRMISNISSIIASYCNRVLVAETVQDVIYPDRDAYPYQVPGGVAPLQLTRYPILDITSVTVTDQGGTATTLVAGTDYTANAGPGQLVRLDQYTTYPTTWLPLATTVIYRGGYDPIPLDIQDAALRLITARFFQRGRDPTLRSESQPGLGDRTYWVGAVPGVKGPYPEDIMGLLDQYRVPVTVA